MRLFDLHCDTLVQAQKTGQQLKKNALQVSLEKGNGYSPWIQTTAIFVTDRLRGQQAVDFFYQTEAFFRQQVSQNPELLVCKTQEDFLKAERGKQIGVMLSVENATALGGDLQAVKTMQRLGVRMMSLTWNAANELGGGVSEPGGLTPFGKAVVREMEHCHIAVDLSHASDPLFDDVIQLATKPPVASHSNSRAVCSHRRNLTDEQFCAITARGGLVGLNLYPLFINGKEDASLDEIYRHLEHFWSLGGQKTTAIGTDFDGATMPSCIPDLACLEQFADFLLGKNTKESLVHDLFFNNAYNFFTRL